jgi:hypothetical protein
VLGELVAEEGEVVLFEGGRGEGCFGVEEAAELGNDAFALWRGGWVLVCVASMECKMRAAARLLTLSSSSWTLASAFFSSSVGFGGMAVCVENCEYVWSDASVCRAVSYSRSPGLALHGSEPETPTTEPVASAGPSPDLPLTPCWLR